MTYIVTVTITERKILNRKGITGDAGALGGTTPSCTSLPKSVRGVSGAEPRSTQIQKGMKKVQNFSRGMAVGIHWLSLVVSIDRAERSIEKDIGLLRDLLSLKGGKESPWWPGKGHKGYRQSVTGPFGCTVGWQPYGPTKAGHDHVLVTLPGQYCEAMPFASLAATVASLCTNFTIVTCTRIDLAFDRCQFTVGQALEAVRRSNVNTQLRRTKNWQGRMVISHKSYIEVTEGEPAHGLEIGQPSASRRIVLYDRRGFVRLELRLRENHAQNAFEQLLLASPDSGEVARSCVSLLRAFIDFIDRGSDTKPSRCTLLPWWQALVGQIPRYRKPSITRKKTTLERQEKWLREHVAKTLYSVASVKSNPRAFIDQLLKHGQSRMKADDRISMFDKNGQANTKTNKEVLDA